MVFLLTFFSIDKGMPLAFGKGSKTKLVAYLGNGTFGRFLPMRGGAKLRHYPECNDGSVEVKAIFL
jgi:hypothetical protein